MPDVGRNDSCTCGSQQKYKHCCLRLQDTREGRRQLLRSASTLYDKNLALIEAAFEIFGLKRGWDRVKLKITGAQVKEFYSFIAALWPPSTDLVALLPELHLKSVVPG
jgi:hypothetical protein